MNKYSKERADENEFSFPSLCWHQRFHAESFKLEISFHDTLEIA